MIAGKCEDFGNGLDRLLTPQKRDETHESVGDSLLAAITETKRLGARFGKLQSRDGWHGHPDSTEVINVPLGLRLPLRGSLRGGTFLASCSVKSF